MEWKDKKLNELMNKYNKSVPLYKSEIEQLWMIIENQDIPKLIEKDELIKLFIGVMAGNQKKVDGASDRSWFNSIVILILMVIVIIDTFIIFSPSI